MHTHSVRPSAMQRFFALAALALATLAVPGVVAADERPRVVATTGMVGDVARRIAGDCVVVDTLMGPGVDPHLYEARASDVRDLRQAEAILYSGYALEGKLGDVLESLGKSRTTLAVAPESIDTGDLITVQDVYGIDPHVWMDVSLWARTIPTITTVLAEVAPDCAEAMDERAEAFAEELAALHDWIVDSVATIPEAQRVLVTAHDAFGYYGRAYGIRVEAIQGISTDSEAGIGDIREMVSVVVDTGVPAVFIESTINRRTVESVIESAADRDRDVEIGGELYADAMGEAGTADGTYIGMMRANTRTIVEALGGDPAPWPQTLAGWAREWEVDNGD